MRSGVIAAGLVGGVVLVNWPWWPAGALVPREAWLLVGGSVGLAAVRPRIGLGALLVGVLLAWAWLGLAWAPVRIEGLGELIWLSTFAGLCLLGTEVADWRLVAKWGAVALIPSLLLQLGNLAGHEFMPYAVTRFSGLFANKNVLGETAGLLLVLCLATRNFWLAIVPGVSVALAQDRTTWLALGVLGVVWVWGRERKAGIALALALAMASLGYVAHSPSAELDASTRFGMWQDAARLLSWRGTGPGSFLILYPTVAKTINQAEERTEELHNDGLQVAIEFGAPGGLLAGGLFLAGLLAGRGPARWALAAFGLIGLASFPLFMPAPAAIGALALGSALRGLRVTGLADAARRVALYQRVSTDQPARSAHAVGQSRSGMAGVAQAPARADVADYASS